MQEGEEGLTVPMRAAFGSKEHAEGEGSMVLRRAVCGRRL